MLEAIYNEEADVLVLLKQKDTGLKQTDYVKNNIRIIFDMDDEVRMVKIFEASVVLGVPKKFLKQLAKR